MMDTIQQLEAKLAAAKLAVKAEVDAAWHAWEPVYRINVTWKDEYTVWISQVPTEECLAEYDALPKGSSVYKTRPISGGMAFTLVGNILTSTGGGSIVIRQGKQFEIWQELTSEQADALRRGECPRELAKPWGKLAD